MKFVDGGIFQAQTRTLTYILIVKALLCRESTVMGIQSGFSGVFGSQPSFL